jgi:hypothetical protein
MQALWTVPLDSFLVAGSSGLLDKTVESLKLSVRLFSCPHRLYSGTTIAQVALWVIRKDLYPIRYWVIGNNDSSICSLGNRDVSCPIAKWVNGTDLCSIRNWVTGNRNDSFCKLGQRDRSLPNFTLRHREQRLSNCVVGHADLP